MKINEEFIQVYKELEDCVRKKGTDIYTIEKTSLSDREQRMLQLCRLKRNWIQHEDNSNEFENATETQVNFIKELTLNIKRQDGICKDYMKTLAKQGCCSSTDTIFLAAGILKKKNVSMIPIIDGNLFKGILTKELVSDLFADGITRNTKIKTNIIDTDINYIDENDPVPENKEFYLVTRGKNKKIIGVLNFK